MIWRATTLIALGLLSGTIGLWASDREAPTVVLSSEILNVAVYPGDDVRIRYHVRRFRSCEVKIDRYLFDGELVRVVLDDLAFASAPGPLGDSHYAIAISLPSRFAPGVGSYRTTSSYVCNPLHRMYPIIVQGEPVMFTVSPQRN